MPEFCSYNCALLLTEFPFGPRNGFGKSAPLFRLWRRVQLTVEWLANEMGISKSYGYGDLQKGGKRWELVSV